MTGRKAAENGVTADLEDVTISPESASVQIHYWKAIGASLPASDLDQSVEVSIRPQN